VKQPGGQEVTDRALVAPLVAVAPPRPGPPRTRNVTIKDIAREAEVSIASVSRVLNNVGRVSDATRARILSIAERLRYVPHEGARSLISNRTATIGMVLPDLHGEFFSELLRGADSAARALQMHLLVSTSHGDPDEAAAAIRSMRGRVDGLLLMSPHIDSNFVARHLSGELPVVLLNAPPGAAPHLVSIDDYVGAVTMVRHLAAAGRTRIAHIAGPVGNSDAAERLRGYHDALAHGADPALVFQGDFSVEAGRAAALAFTAVSPRPDAIFAANDMMAAGCMEALSELGVVIPDEIAIGGFDDVPLAHFLSPPLTTMRIDVARFGRTAIDRLVAAIAGQADMPPVEKIVPTLVIRQSCGHASNHSRTTSLQGAEHHEHA
jgi:LacI family transcriptional regulator